MTDTAPETDVDPQAPDDEGNGDEADWIKQLRRDAKEGKAAKAQLAVLERDRAFDKAGIPEEGAGKWFRKGYEGELDPDAIRAAAASDGLIDVTSDEDTEAAAQANAATEAAGRIADAASEGGPPQPTVEALLAEANSLDEIEKVMQDAGLGAAPT